MIPLAIKSCSKNIERQTSIRNTWLKLIDLNKYKPIFLIGNEKLDKDYDLQDDILYLKADDSYRGLSGKMKKYYLWGINETNSTHFWSVDDDSYVNAKLFNINESVLYFDYVGSFIYGLKKNNEKGGYTSGCGTCISRKCAEQCIVHLEKMSDNDDISIGDIINKFVPDVKKYHDIRIHPWSYCTEIKNLLIGHYIHKKIGGAPETKTFDECMKLMHSFYTKD